MSFQSIISINYYQFWYFDSKKGQSINRLQLEEINKYRWKKRVAIKTTCHKHSKFFNPFNVIKR